MAKRHHVHFEALKKVIEPVKVSFKTGGGEKISFKAHRPVKETVDVDFMVKN